MITELQTRIAAILGNTAAFSGVTILSDARPDFVSEVAQAIGRQDLVVAVGFAEGENIQPSAAAPFLDERVRVAVIQHRLHTAHSAVVLMEEAMKAIHNQPVTASVSGPQRFSIRSHSTAIDEDGVRVCECVVGASLILK